MTKLFPVPWPRPPSGDLRQVNQKLDTILANQVKIMSDIGNLQQAETDLANEVAAIATQMDTLLADLNAALAGGNPAAIQAATAAIEAQVTALKAAGTRDAPPSPTPAPVP